MFDIGFAELVIIAVVALLVIGPERLPDAVRTASAWINRFRRGFNEIKQEVQQELHNDAVMRELRESGEKLRRETEALRQDLSVTATPTAEPQPTSGSDIQASDSEDRPSVAADELSHSQAVDTPDEHATSPELEPRTSTESEPPTNTASS